LLEGISGVSHCRGGRTRQTPEAIDEEAATHRLKIGLQRGREIEILIAVPGPCLNFKEQTNHRNSSAACDWVCGATDGLSLGSPAPA